MTIDKDWKRLVRARMKKTGESYTAARANLLRKTPAPRAETAAALAVAPPRAAPPKASPAPRDYAKLAAMADATIKAKTGCTWERWVGALDYAKAYEWSHTEIAAHVHEKYKIPGWWAQAVTTGYERIKGLRAVGQRRSGEWEASCSRTLPVAVGPLFRAFRDAKSRSRWLDGAPFAIRTAVRNKSMRVTWKDGTSVEVYFVAKGTAKAQVSIQHRKLVDAAAVARSKAYWGERLDALRRVLRDG